MKKVVAFFSIGAFAFIIAGCSGITTLAGPLNKPELTGSIDDHKWNFSISIHKGGTLNHKFLNLKHVQGNALWLNHRLQIYEAGVVTLDVVATSPYLNNSLESSDLPLQVNISHVPTLSRSGVAILTWRILYSKSAVDGSDSAEVLSGSESIGMLEK